MAVPFSCYATDDGAFGSKSADMFPTMAACKVAKGLNRPLEALPDLRRAVLARRTPTGGLGAQPGQPADVWTTCYGIESLSQACLPVPASMTSYLLSLERDGGFAMAAGQQPETWSTAFAITALSQCGVPIPDPEATLAWLAGAHLPSGGFTWSREWTSRGRADVRATAFVIKGLKTAGLITAFQEITDLDATVNFLRSMQERSGGFRLDHRHPPCMWGSGEAVVTLGILGQQPPDPDACISFLRSMRRHDGGYRRGSDYPDHSDLWATMHGVLGRIVLHDEQSDERVETMTFVESCRVPDGGYTYRPPASASDVLVTSAAAIAIPLADNRAFHFLATCRMPGEGGVAFMPARGSEARSALWTVTALARNGEPHEEEALGRWARSAQNPDGGFGPWEGRASNAVSTNAVLTALTTSGHDLTETIDLPAAAEWIETTMALHQVGDPEADLVDLSSLLCASDTIGLNLDNRPVRAALGTHRRGATWRRNRRTFPDLLATYVALTAHQVLGNLDRVLDDAAAWVGRLPSDESGTAWSNLSNTGGGPLPTALATLILAAAHSGDFLPNLTL